MDHTKGTKKRALIATIAIFGSRILGLVREQVFAFFFGAGAVLDAFYVAFRIPNLLRDLAAEGALSQSFITIFSQKLGSDKTDEAKALANKTITFIILIMAAIVILGEIFAPYIVRVIATGFTGQKFELTVSLLRILFPYIFFISIAALLMGVLNANKKFFVPFSASTFGNFTAITAGLLCAYFFSPDYITETFHKLFFRTQLITEDYLAIANAITGMAFGTLLGGFAQFIIQLPSVCKLGFKPKFDFKFKDNNLMTVLKLTGPAILAGAAVQVNVLVNTEFASLLADGSVAYLQFAFRFMQFPLGVFGVAIAAASAPILAQMISQKREDKFRESIRSSIQMSLFLSLPSMVGLIVIGKAIISLVYQHGHFSTYDTEQTAFALMAYALGISSYSLIKIYQPAYLAFHDAKTPMKIAMLSIAINLIINGTFILVLHFTHWALALGTAIVACIDIILQTILFRKKLKGIWTQDLILNTVKTLLATIIMGIVVFYFHNFLNTFFINKSLGNRFLLVIFPILLAIPTYLGSAYFLKVHDAHFLLSKAFKKLKQFRWLDKY